LVPSSPKDGDIPAKREDQGMEGSKARKGALLVPTNFAAPIVAATTLMIQRSVRLP